MHSRTHRNTEGFTLIELMVAISIMALIALMGWRALDGMQRANTQTQSHTDAVLASMGLSQAQIAELRQRGAGRVLDDLYLERHGVQGSY